MLSVAHSHLANITLPADEQIRDLPRSLSTVRISTGFRSPGLLNFPLILQALPSVGWVRGGVTLGS